MKDRIGKLNPKILAALITIIGVAVFFICLAVSGNRKEDGSSTGVKTAGKETSSIRTVKNEETTTKADKKKTAEKETENAAGEEKAQAETNADGTVTSVTTSDGKTIDLKEAESRAGKDGTVTYLMPDGSSVTVDKDGQAKVTYTARKEEGNPTEGEGIKTAETGQGAQPTAQTQPQPAVQPTTQQNTRPEQQPQPTQQPAAPTQSAPEQQPQPTQQTAAPTQSAPEPQPQPAACSHSNTKKQITQAATETGDGAWEEVCVDCGAKRGSGSIHAYGTYLVYLGNGQTDVVYGYYNDALADEVYQQLNEYRAANGLNTLTRTLDNYARVRAYESAYSLSHYRPNGQMSYEIAPSGVVGRENLHMSGVYLGDGIHGGELIMQSWKNSPGHNDTMLDAEVKDCGISVFIKVSFDENGIAEPTELYAVQEYDDYFTY